MNLGTLKARILPNHSDHRIFLIGVVIKINKKNYPTGYNFDEEIIELDTVDDKPNQYYRMK